MIKKIKDKYKLIAGERLLSCLIPPYIDDDGKVYQFKKEIEWCERRLFKALLTPTKLLKGRLETFSEALVKYREVRSLYNNTELTLGKKK